MSFIFRKIKKLSGGREIVRDTKIPKDAITVGRDTESDVYLSDLRVALKHLRIETSGRSKISVASVGERAFRANGRFTRRHSFDGTEDIGVGPYHLYIGREEADGPVIIRVERTEPKTLPAPAEDEVKIFTLKKIKMAA